MGPWTLNVPLTFDFTKGQEHQTIGQSSSQKPWNTSVLSGEIKTSLDFMTPGFYDLTWPAWKFSVFFSEIWQEQNIWGFSNGHVRFFGGM